MQDDITDVIHSCKFSGFTYIAGLIPYTDAKFIEAFFGNGTFSSVLYSTYPYRITYLRT